MSLRIRRYGAADGVSSTTWTAIAPIEDRNNLSISNREGSDALWICTDPTDASTMLYLPEGAEQGFSAPPHKYGYDRPHFLENAPAVYVKTVSGSGPVIAIWL